MKVWDVVFILIQYFRTFQTLSESSNGWCKSFLTPVEAAMFLINRLPGVEYKRIYSLYQESRSYRDDGSFSPYVFHVENKAESEMLVFQVVPGEEGTVVHIKVCGLELFLNFSGGMFLLNSDSIEPLVGKFPQVGDYAKRLDVYEVYFYTVEELILSVLNSLTHFTAPFDYYNSRRVGYARGDWHER